MILNRFGPNGLYLLDEPEAALSTQNCLTCLQRIHQLVLAGSQFISAFMDGRERFLHPLLSD